MSYDVLGRLPDPTTIPAGPGFISLAITDNSPGMVHPLNDGGSVGVKFEGNYWTVTLGYPKLTPAESIQIHAFLESLGGPFTNFYVELPTLNSLANGNLPSEPLAANVSQVGVNSNQLKIVGITDNTFSVGDPIKLTNHPKIYKIVNKEIDGSASILTLNCSILSPTTIATASLEIGNILMRVRLTSSFKAPTLNSDGLYEGFSVSLRENIK